MRKVLVVLTGLILSCFWFSCSEDSTTTPPPTPPEFDITTVTLPVGYTCSPYKVQLEAVGGSGPYNWGLAVGSDPLPAGLSMSADGEIVGVIDEAGEWTITVACEDNSDTPNTDAQELTINVEVPANPSLAVFFDGDATICNGETVLGGPWGWLDCYVYIMLQDSDVGCCTATEFMLRLTDADGVDLEAGTDYNIVSEYTDFSHVAIKDGTLFSGISIAFHHGMYSFEPIIVASFTLMLNPDLEDLTFEFAPDPYAQGGHTRPIITTCDDGFPIVEVDGRTAAVNYNVTQ